MDVPNDDLAQEVGQWLQLVVEWQQSSPSVQLLQKQQKLVQKLSTFLESLSEKLQTFNGVEEAVTSLPQVGQVLGRLVTCPFTLCHPNLYQSLMTCILWFYVDNPTNPVEVKAKKWAVSQVRSTVCHSRKQLSSKALDVTGTTQETFNSMCLDQMLKGGWTHFNTSSEMSENHSKCVGHSTMLVDACKICAGLTHIECLSHLLEKMLFALTNISQDMRNEDNVRHLYELLADTQRGAYTDAGCKVSLSYSAQLTLWKAYLPSLEQEVLTLVSASTDQELMMSASNLQLLIKSRHLVRACSEDVQIYSAVSSMLYFLWHQTGGSTNITRILASLHSVISLHCSNSSSETVLCLVSLYPREIQALVALLEVPPTILDRVAAEHQILTLSHHLSTYCPPRQKDDFDVGRHGTASEDTFSFPQYVFLHYNEWYNLALVLALMGKKEVSNACCDILLAFINSTQMDDRNEVLGVVMALRSFMSRPRVHWHDIECAVCTSHSMEGSRLDKNKTTSAVIGQLLMIFLTHSICGFSVAKEVMSKIFGFEDALSHLVGLLDTLTVTSVFWASPLGLTPMRPGVVLDLVNLLIQEIQKDKSPVQNRFRQQTKQDGSPCDLGHPEEEPSFGTKEKGENLSHHALSSAAIRNVEDIKKLLMETMSAS